MTNEQIALELVKTMIKADSVDYVEQNAEKVAKAYNTILKSISQSSEQTKED